MQRKKIKNKKRKSLYKLALVLFAVSLITFIFSIYLKDNDVLERYVIYLRLGVSGVTGIDLNKTALTFGNIVPGNTGSRSFFIQNGYSFPVKVDISVKGEVKRFIYFDNNFVVNTGEKKVIGVSAFVPYNEVYGNYSGELVVTLRKS